MYVYNRDVNYRVLIVSSLQRRRDDSRCCTLKN